MPMRAACLFMTLGLLGLTSACSAPQIVDCAPGRFVRVEGEPWCVFQERSGTCPSVLPVEHRLDFGGRGCAKERFDPTPAGLCTAAGFCGDAG